MASADFRTSIPKPLGSRAHRQRNGSPRVRRVTFLTYTCRIYFHTSRVTRVIIGGLWIYWPPRPDVAASYAVPVHRNWSLPSASFGSHLAVGTLAVRLTVHSPGFVGDLHPHKVTSRFACAHRFQAPVTALRAMTGVPIKNGAEGPVFHSFGFDNESFVRICGRCQRRRRLCLFRFDRSCKNHYPLCRPPGHHKDHSWHSCRYPCGYRCHRSWCAC